MSFSSPQDVEDAFYDAIDENDPQAMIPVWSSAQEAACLLPMQPLILGGEQIATHWQNLMLPGLQVEISVRHLHWIEGLDLAVHLVEETFSGDPSQGSRPPIYGTNVYRREADGWKLLMHLNAPLPPAPGSLTMGLTLPEAPPR